MANGFPASISTGRRTTYADPDFPGEGKYVELVDALRSVRKAILTSDIVSADGREFKRTGYIAVYAIEPVITKPDLLSFQLTESFTNLA